MPKPIKGTYPLTTTVELYKMIKVAGGLKHLYKWNSVVPFINNDPMLSINVGFYQSFLDKKNCSIKLWRYAGDYAKLKELSQWAQKSGTFVKDFQDLVGVENLYGWRPNNDDVTDDVRSWVEKVFKPTYNGSEKEFNERFRLAVRKTLNWKQGQLLQTETLADFCTNIAETGTSGSAYDPGGPRLEAEYDGINVKPYNNKFSKSAVLSVENKIKRALAMKKQKCKVSTKLEFYPKKRLIVSADYDTTLKMRFIDTWLKKWMEGNNKSTLWMTSDQTKDMWLHFSKSRAGANCPVDQSKFDHHVSKTMVSIMLEEVDRLIAERSINGEELLKVMKTIIFALDGGNIVWDRQLNDKVTEHLSALYKNGVLSGWQWTAFLDTLANVAEHEMALDMMRENGVSFIELWFNAQGDDQFEQFTTFSACAAYWACLTSMGFELHPFKNFFSNSHNEYLRKVSYKGSVNGYAARMVNGLLWLYPGTNQQQEPLGRLKDIVNNWAKFSERLNLEFDAIRNDLLKDAVGAKLSKEESATYIHTPRTLGGYGMEPLIMNREIKTDAGKWVNIKINGKGYSQFKARFGADQIRGLNKWMLDVTNMPTVVKHKELKNRDKIQLTETQPLKSIAFDMIKGLGKKKFVRNADEPLNTLFSTDKEVMKRYFPNFEQEVKNTHAPRSWLAEYASGKLKYVTPRVPNLSDEMASLFWTPYKQSLAQAMMFKVTRNSNKWLGLNIYAENNFRNIIGQHPRMVG